MYTLRIEHPVPDFDGWKRAFDADPVGRQRAGVVRYRVMRPADDARYAMVDLDLETAEAAEALLAALRQLWSRVEGEVMRDPRARILEVVEVVEVVEPA